MYYLTSFTYVVDDAGLNEEQDTFVYGLIVLLSGKRICFLYSPMFKLKV